MSTVSTKMGLSYLSNPPPHIHSWFHGVSGYLLVNGKNIQNFLVNGFFSCKLRTYGHIFFIFFTDVMGGSHVECSVNNSKYQRFHCQGENTDAI